ncbi:MAG: hypothetical protein WAK22_16275, partial [Candidatus Sulfotelmatobacter sp.]
SHMLGTRRSSVTVAAGILQSAGLITYTVAQSILKIATGWKMPPANATTSCAGAQQFGNGNQSEHRACIAIRNSLRRMTAAA